MRVFQGAALYFFALISALLSPERAAAQDRDNAALLEAQRRLEARRPQEAKVILDELLSRNPQLADAYRLRAQAELALGRKTEARAAFLKALENGRFTGDVLGNLALLDRESKNLNAALTNARWLVVLAPEEPRWRDLLLELLLATGAESEAASLLAAELSARPEDPELQLRAGNIALAKGDFRRAAEALTLAYYLGRRDARLARTISDLHRQLGEASQSLLWADRAISLGATETPEQGLLRASALADSGRIAESQRLLEELVAAKTGAWQLASRRLAALAQSRGDDRAALAALEPLGADPMSAVQRALLALRLNEPQKALAALESAGPSAQVQKLRARAYWSLDRRDEAMKALSQSIALEGWDSDAESLLLQWTRAQRSPER